MSARSDAASKRCACAPPAVAAAPAPSRASEPSAAGGEVAHGLGDDHRHARGGAHAAHDRLRARQEVVEARLHDDDVGDGQLGGRHVGAAGVDAAPAQARDEALAGVQRDVGADPPAQLALVQPRRAAAQLEHARPVGHVRRDGRVARRVVASVQNAHREAVAPRAAVDEALGQSARIATRGASVTEISVVIPVYNCAGCLRALHERLTATLTALTPDYEIVLVDDRSRDGAWEILTSSRAPTGTCASCA